MSKEKICFRYDGNEEAKKCIQWINEHRDRIFFGDDICYYFNLPNENHCFSNNEQPSTHRLVAPAEFLRIVTGEKEEWQPKWGEEVEVSDDEKTWDKRIYVGKNPCEMAIRKHITVNEGGVVMAWYYIRPVHKSLREEVHNFIKDEFSCYIALKDIDRIIELIKQKKDEN